MTTDHIAHTLFYICHACILCSVYVQCHENRNTLAATRSHFLAFIKEMPHSSIIVLPAYSTVTRQWYFHLMNQPVAKIL